MSLSKVLATVCLSGSMMFVLGCGPGGPKTSPVSGKITIGGQPAQGVSVNFGPVDGSNNTASGVVNNGSYELYTGSQNSKGAVAGKYKVYLTQSGDQSLTPDYMKAGSTDGAAPVVKLSFPPEYLDPEKSPIEKEVKAGDNKIDIDIPGPGDAAPAGGGESK